MSRDISPFRVGGTKTNCTSAGPGTSPNTLRIPEAAAHRAVVLVVKAHISFAIKLYGETGLLFCFGRLSLDGGSICLTDVLLLVWYLYVGVKSVVL